MKKWEFNDDIPAEEAADGSCSGTLCECSGQSGF